MYPYFAVKKPNYSLKDVYVIIKINEQIIINKMDGSRAKSQNINDYERLPYFTKIKL